MEGVSKPDRQPVTIVYRNVHETVFPEIPTIHPYKGQHMKIENLVVAAKNNNTAAEELFVSLLREIRNIHEYGPDGMRRRPISDFAQPFNNLQWEILTVFKNAIRLYNSEKKAGFLTFLKVKMHYAAIDRIQEAQKDREKFIRLESFYNHEGGDEENAENNLTDAIITESHAEWVNSAYGNEDEQDEAYERVQKLFAMFPEDSREHEYLTLLLHYSADGKKHTSEICEAMGCTRQNLTYIKKNIIAKARQAA